MTPIIASILILVIASVSAYLIAWIFTCPCNEAMNKDERNTKAGHTDK